ncbi:hypothetical protein ScPMuIL_014806 [Solemya velum]
MAASVRADERLAQDITEEHLLCAICSEKYVDPRQLPCGHTFCYRCIDRHITTWPGPCCPLCNAPIVPCAPDIDKQDWACYLPQSVLIADIEKILYKHEYPRDGTASGARHTSNQRGKGCDNLDPEVRLEQLCDFASEIVASENFSPRQHKWNGLLICRTARSCHEEGDIERAFVLYMRVLSLFIEKLPRHSQYSSLNPSEVTEIKQKIKEILPVAERVKARLRKTYQAEAKRKERIEERTRTALRLRRMHTTARPLTPTAPLSQPRVSFVTPTKSPNNASRDSPQSQTKRKAVRFVDEGAMSPTVIHFRELRGDIKSKPPPRPPPPQFTNG